ncbi:MAG: hypothetical protein AAFR11_10380 [Pseudomonadota bacterium]
MTPPDLLGPIGTFASTVEAIDLGVLADQALTGMTTSALFLVGVLLAGSFVKDAFSLARRAGTTRLD